MDFNLNLYEVGPDGSRIYISSEGLPFGLLPGDRTKTYDIYYTVPHSYNLEGRFAMRFVENATVHSKPKTFRKEVEFGFTGNSNRSSRPVDSDNPIAPVDFWHNM